jgi:RNA polymerase sigma factor (sigma-70 family)
MTKNTRATVSTEETRALATAAVAGDTMARDQLARHCLPRVRRTVVMSYGYGPDQDDLVQTAMAKVFMRLDSYRGESSFFVWADRVTINVVRDHYRRQKWTWLPWFDDEALPDDGRPRVSPENEVARAEILERLAEHFGKLKPGQRLPLVLHLVHGYTVAEVAAIMDIRLEATRKRLLRGKKELVRRVSMDPACRRVLVEGE